MSSLFYRGGNPEMGELEVRERDKASALRASHERLRAALEKLGRRSYSPACACKDCREIRDECNAALAQARALDQPTGDER